MLWNVVLYSGKLSRKKVSRFSCLCLSYGLALASPKSSGPPGRILYWYRFSRIRNTSSYFDFHLLTALSLRYRRPTAGELRNRSLIPWLHRIPSNLSRLFGGELYVRAARRPILGAAIECKVSGCILVGTANCLWSHCAWQRVFRIRKRPRLNQKYFNRAMIAREPCYNGTIYDRNFANEKISRINFRDFAQIAKNAKVKPRKIFPLYGIPTSGGSSVSPSNCLEWHLH